MICGLGLGAWVVMQPDSAPAAAAPAHAYSNIERGDYVGPEACGKCHEDNYELWKKHPHSRMNANADERSVMGDFSGTSLSYGGFANGPDRFVPAGTATFYKKDDAFMVDVASPDGDFQRRFKVVRTIGSRLVQMYTAIQLEGPEPQEHAIYKSELRLPYGWHIRRNRWLSTPFFDHGYVLEPTENPIPQHITPGLDVWTTNCATCHNTYAYSQRWDVKTVYHAGYKRDDFTGARALEPKGAEISPDDLITVGISCESCHFGGREHAENEQPMRFMPVHPDLQFTRDDVLKEGVPEQKTPYVVNAICNQCHGRPIGTYPNGSVDANSAEGYDMRTSCGGQVKCTDCHNPHTAGPVSGGGGADDPAHVGACLKCHEDYSSPEAAAKHSRHPVSAQVSCLDCHMPRIVRGIQIVTRTHRIASPTDLATFNSGAPNPCNLCHLDQTIEWALDTMATRWDLGQVRPEAKRNIPKDVASGDFWLNGPDYVRRVMAADAYSRSPLGKGALPKLLDALADPYPFARFLIRPAVERVLGRTLERAEYDIAASAEERKRQTDALLKREQAAPE